MIVSELTHDLSGWGLFALERAKVVTGSPRGRFAILDAEEIYGSLAPGRPEMTVIP
jgi:hypothetical protein